MKISKLLVILSAMVIPATALASNAYSNDSMNTTSATTVAPKPVNPYTAAIKAADDQVGIAATGTLMNYQENLPSPSDTESGWMPGFRISGSYLYGNHIYASVKYGYNSGSIAYKGGLIGSTQPYDSTDDATTQKVMAKLGYSLWLCNNMAVTPYVAGGYQSWNRDLVGPYGYTENYSSALIGLGAKLQYAYTPRMVLTGDAEFLAVQGGSMTPSLGNGILGSAQFPTTGEERVSAGVNYRISGPWTVFGGLSYTHFNYGGGLLQYGYFEPFSATNRFTLDGGIGYQF